MSFQIIQSLVPHKDQSNTYLNPLRMRFQMHLVKSKLRVRLDISSFFEVQPAHITVVIIGGPIINRILFAYFCLAWTPNFT